MCYACGTHGKDGNASPTCNLDPMSMSHRHPGSWDLQSHPFEEAYAGYGGFRHFRSVTLDHPFPAGYNRGNHLSTASMGKARMSGLRLLSDCR